MPLADPTPPSPSPAPAGIAWPRVVLLLGVLGLVLGWNDFRFLCDDAFIDFRYAANLRAGYGLVWNLPPFRPVEGYTSLLWVLLLDGVWGLTGLDPTRSAEWLGLAFSVGTLLQTAAWARSCTPRGWTPALQAGLLAVVLAGTLSNRTFLAWTSSGLETPLWVFLLLSWSRAMWARGAPGNLPGDRWASLAPAVWAGLMVLTRPDGALFAGLTAIELARARRWGALWPLLTLPGQLLWRHHTYGFWLPNTAYAKVAGAWPRLGAEYLGSFVLEYAWWWGGLAGLAILGREVLARRRAPSPPLRPSIPRALMVLGLVGQAAWYTFWVGGDHFEFRIYAHLVPLGWLLFVGLLARRDRVDAVGLGVVAGQLLLSLPIPWTHHALATVKAQEDGPVHMLIVPVAPALPAPLAWLAAPWDALQDDLIHHYVGIRYEEHRIYAERLRYIFGPRRADLPSLDPSDIPAYAAISIGVAGWALPNAAVLDVCGLVDAVVAHNPDLRPNALMAHQRQPPAGYIQCFDPDVDFDDDGKLVRRKRAAPLTPERVRACEDRYWQGL